MKKSTLFHILFVSCLSSALSQSCDCNSPEVQHCTDDVLNTMAGQYTCGARITWLMDNGYTELQACRKVAGEEFPSECGKCDPDTCWNVPNPSTVRTVAPTLPPALPPANLYCFPPEVNRVTHSNVWNSGDGGSFKVQVKEGDVCGPGNNRFSRNTVSLSRGAMVGEDKLTLQVKKNPITGVWEASEVRIVNSDERPFKYGNYTFHVESVAVKNASGQTISDILPANVVLGLFTWDDTDRYAVHENWNHEVDIEMSRWGGNENADMQFLMQPPKSPQMYRFFSGTSPNTFDQSNHWHSFRWLPNRISWLSTSGGGQSHLYTTEDAILNNREDFVQCLPADVELRINLWIMEGVNAPPQGLQNEDFVEVVLGKFIYEEAGIDYVAPGDYCSKHCQCASPQGCVNGRCLGTTPAPVESTSAPITSTPAPVVESTPAPIKYTLAPVASTPAPTGTTPAPVQNPTSNCEIKTQVGNIETKVESIEIDVQGLESKLIEIENTATSILSILQTSTAAPVASVSTSAPTVSTSAPTTAAPVIRCTDRTDRFQFKDGSPNRNWCRWVREKLPNDIPRQCRIKNLTDHCPQLCQKPECFPTVR